MVKKPKTTVFKPTLKDQDRTELEQSRAFSESRFNQCFLKEHKICLEKSDLVLFKKPLSIVITYLQVNDFQRVQSFLIKEFKRIFYSLLF